jgi:hypothetical protein
MATQLTTGQPVRWPPAPRGFAQVEEVRRKCVRLFYVTKSGRSRRPVVRVDRIDTGDVLAFPNPFGRAAGMTPRTREYPPPQTPCQE